MICDEHFSFTRNIYEKKIILFGALLKETDHSDLQSKNETTCFVSESSYLKHSKIILLEASYVFIAFIWVYQRYALRYALPHTVQSNVCCT